jgi:hypothetical protein
MTKDQDEKARDAETDKGVASITEPLGWTLPQSNTKGLFTFTRESFEAILKAQVERGEWPTRGTE